MPIMLLKKPSAIIALYQSITSIKGDLLASKPLSKSAKPSKVLILGIRSVTDTALSNSVTGEIIYTPPVSEAVIRENSLVGAIFTLS